MKIIDAQLAGNENVDKAQLEQYKADAEIQKEALKLRQEELKTINLENKTYGGF